jgi:methenyltetrahydrofolate cyclohydrolase
VYLDMPLGDFLAEVGAGHAPPAAGCAIAACVALSASLCAMTARLSRRQLIAPLASELTAEAERLGARAAALVQADAEAVRQMLSPGEPTASAGEAAVCADSTATPPTAAGGPAGAALVPLELLEVAVQVAQLADRLAAGGNANLRGDAVCARLIAVGAAQSAAALVRIDLAGAPATDPRLHRADVLQTEVGT